MPTKAMSASRFPLGASGAQSHGDLPRMRVEQASESGHQGARKVGYLSINSGHSLFEGHSCPRSCSQPKGPVSTSLAREHAYVERSRKR